MKKLALIIAIVGIVGLSSCSKDYVCTKSGETVTISDDNVVLCDANDVCLTYTYDEIKLLNSEITDKSSAKSYSEDQGYSCK